MSETLKPSSSYGENQKNEKGESACNIYDKKTLLPEKAKECLDSLVKDFKEYYLTLGYKEEPAVKISSGIDPTVRFIGSHISVFKPYLADESIPNPGLFMNQGCLRTRNVDKLLDDNYSPSWGSYFTSIGAVTPPERLADACNEAFDFLEKRLAISPSNILIRISATDTDLLAACRQRYKENTMEIDTRKPEYYRHNIGMEGVRGRNFNIALRDSKNRNEFSDIGNIILLENTEKQLGVEVALGSSTILKQLYGLDHVQDCTPVIGLNNIENTTIRRKFEDAIITSTVLYAEGLRPLGQNNRNRILKQYVKSLSYFRVKSKMSIETLTQTISDFETNVLLTSPDQASAVIIVEFVKAFENELSMKKNLTDDERRIKDSLELLK